MSGQTPRRGVLSRADLVVALAVLDGRPPDATALTIAHALGLEWQPPEPEPQTRKRSTSKGKSRTVQVDPTPAINRSPLLETPFYRAEEVEFFAETDEVVPPPPVMSFEKWRNPPKEPPSFQPLATWAELAPRLRKVLSHYLEGRTVDLSLTVRQISRGHLLARFPLERRRRWGPALLLIEDESHRLTPFRDDRRLVRWAVQSLLPRHSLFRARMDEHLVRPECLGKDDAYWPPPPGTLVLALSDLGCLARTGEGARQDWADMGQILQEAGCHPVALFPGPLARATPELAALWQLVPWERPRSHDGVALEQRTERLLRLLSPAVRITPGLLRAVRLLLPEAQADAGTEADVWQHADFNSHLVAAALVPERAQTLRRELSRETGAAALQLRSRLIHCLKAHRWDLPPEIWFDEVLNFDPEALDTPELAQDREDAQAYFGKFCDDNRDLAHLAMPGCDRRWFLRVKSRAPDLLWRDEKVGKRLAQLALAVDPEGAPPSGVGARDIPPDGRPERNIYLAQRGARLAASEDAAVDRGLGSSLGILPSRNGLVEMVLDQGTRVEEGDAFWASSQPPAWARAWGWDDYGAWVEFAVPASKPPRRGRAKRDDDGPAAVTQRMRWIPPGRFLMGSPETEPERFDWEGPQQEVTIVDGYWLFDTACTQALWQAVMGTNPSYFKGDGRLPVEQVSWHDTQTFTQALNHRLPGLALSLPSEAQWEYACRAGTTTPFSFGEKVTTDQVNYNGIYLYGRAKPGPYRGKTVRVGSLPANPWGLHEMLGNVWEWTQDSWHDSHNGAPKDGYARGPARVSGPRVVRGGSWNDFARDCRCAYRFRYRRVSRLNYLGFRCARVQAGGQDGARPAERNRPGAVRFEARCPDKASSAVSPTSSGNVARLESAAERIGGTRAGQGVVRLAAGSSVALPLPPGPQVRILTDCASLTLRKEPKPAWARAMGRDRFGLWAEFEISSVIQRLRWIPPGRFTMGSPEDEPGRWPDEGPRHVVTIRQGFWLFDTPCTQALWEAVMEDNPSYFISPTRPVEQVSWDDAQEFLVRINARIPGLDLVLPSEAQWEYACRAGTDTALYSGPIKIIGDNNAPALDFIAWYGGNSGEGFDLDNGSDTRYWPDMQYPNAKAGTRPVKGKQPNPWGLFDMLGNVLEWTQDDWLDSYKGAPVDGSARQSGEIAGPRVVRGGSWSLYARYCRCAFRNRYGPDDRDYLLGFRCARVQA